MINLQTKIETRVKNQLYYEDYNKGGNKMVNTKELIDEVLIDNLKKSVDKDLDAESATRALNAAVTLLDKKIEIRKTDLSAHNEKKNRMIKILEVVAVPVGLVVLSSILDYRSKVTFIDMISRYEKEDIFTTTPGRSLSQLFKWK